MKAIHNTDSNCTLSVGIVSNMSKILNESNSQHTKFYLCRRLIVSNMSKILNESNSQLVSRKRLKRLNCFQYVKDTK